MPNTEIPFFDENMATTAVRAGINSDQQHGAVIPSIHLSSTYSLKRFNEKREFEYSRTGNPTRAILERAIAKLEHGECGIVTNTGTSATLLLCQLLQAGDIVVIPHDLYGGSYRLFNHLAQKGNFQLRVIDQANQAALDNALASRPRLVLIETPSNPLLRVIDIEKVAEASHKAGALVAVDNTFLSPVLQNPILLGADIVIHSTTKFINGHSDIVGGALVTASKEIGEALSWWANCIGVTSSAFDSYMAIRGLKTLPIRMKQHQHNADLVADFLVAHPAVKKVYYPGLSSQVCREIVNKQQRSPGSILSFELHGGLEAVERLLGRLDIWTLAQSLGGVESLISHPATMTHVGMNSLQQKKAGIKPELLRLSVGIEFAGDLLSDLEAALNQIT